MLFDGFSSSRVGRCLDSGSGSRGRTRCLFPFPTHTHFRACPPSDRSPVGNASPGCIMHAIHPAQSQYHVHSRPPPPSNSTASSSSRPPPAQQPHQNPREPVTVVAVPSVTVEYNQLIVGDARTCQFNLINPFARFPLLTPLSFFLPFLFLASTRSYTPLKVVGDGSFGTVWLCDWHGTLPPNTPLSAMQCGPGARPEYASKRLVAVKRMKKRWEGGWDECKKLKELEVRSFQPRPSTLVCSFLVLNSSR